MKGNTNIPRRNPWRSSLTVIGPSFSGRSRDLNNDAAISDTPLFKSRIRNLKWEIWHEKKDPLPCKPDSVPRTRRGGDHFSSRSGRDPAGAGCDYYPGILVGRATLPLFCLAPRGVCRAPSVAVGAVGSYPTFSPLPVPRGALFAEFARAIGGLFSAALSVRFRSHETVPCFRRARCPPVSGLSSKPSRAPRPPGKRTRTIPPNPPRRNPDFRNLQRALDRGASANGDAENAPSASRE